MVLLSGITGGSACFKFSGSLPKLAPVISLFSSLSEIILPAAASPPPSVCSVSLISSVISEVETRSDIITSALLICCSISLRDLSSPEAQAESLAFFIYSSNKSSGATLAPISSIILFNVSSSGALI